MSVSVSYQSKKCTSCGGRVEFLPDKEVWKCLYCGAEMEREESYDGLYTIKNVARQALSDTAYRRLESAARNILECEKIDTAYAGTIVAKIAYDVISSITPGAVEEHQLRNVLSNVKRNYTRLLEQGQRVSDVEQAFYDSLEGDGDVFATLLLVFDSLGDENRKTYMEAQLKPENIHSLETNTNLLGYAIKNENNELVDKIIANTSNINQREAFFIILNSYPDGEQKAENLEKLSGYFTALPEDALLIEGYLEKSEDSLKTKAVVVQIGLVAGISPRLESIINNVLSPSSLADIAPLVTALLGEKLTDTQIYSLLDFALAAEFEKGEFILRELLSSSQFVVIAPKHLGVVLGRQDLSTDEQIALIEKLSDFKLEERTFTTVFNSYLLDNASPPETRLEIIKKLLEYIDDLPTATVESYVVQSTTDGELKAEIIKELFGLGLNISFYQNLINSYLSRSKDTPEIRDSVVAFLMEKGLKTGGDTLESIVLSNSYDTQYKIDFLRKAKQKGEEIPSGVYSSYLERYGEKDFNGTLFSLLSESSNGTVSFKGFKNYLLYCRDFSQLKLDNISKMLSQPFSKDDIITVEHLGSSIQGNIAQAYMLITPDEEDISQGILEMLKSAGLKISPRIMVNGVQVRVKKYFADNKEKLGEVSLFLGENERMFSLF